MWRRPVVTILILVIPMILALPLGAQRNWSADRQVGTCDVAPTLPRHV